MTNDSSILYITSLLDNPDTITEGDHGSILLYRQTFPYFVPARYMEALELHKEERFSPGMLASMQSYMGNWSLFCDFLEAGVSGKKSAWPVAKGPDAKAADVIPGQVARVTSKKGAGGSVQEQLAAVTPIVVGAGGSVQKAAPVAPIVVGAGGSVQKAAPVAPIIETVKQVAAAPVVPKTEIPAVPKLEVPAAAAAAPVVPKVEIPAVPKLEVPEAAPVAAPVVPKQEIPAAQAQQKSSYATMPKSAETVRREAEARNTAGSQEAGSRRQEAAPVVPIEAAVKQEPVAAPVAGGSVQDAVSVAPLAAAEKLEAVAATVVSEAAAVKQEAVPVVPKIEETVKQDIVIPAPTQRVETIAEMQARATAEALEMMKKIEIPAEIAGSVQEQVAESSRQEAVAALVVPKTEIPPVAAIVTPVVPKQEVPVAKTAEPPQQETPVVTNPVKQAEPVVREIVIPRLSAPPPPRNVPPKPAPAKEKEEPLIQPLYTADYFRQQGEKVSEEIPEEIKEYKAPVNMMTEAEKSLMVMMSFTEWLLHFRDTSARHQEEKKEQKALKTMWQKEKLAAAIEEENDEIPENVFEMAVNSIAKEDGLASESLAEIYIKQEKYDKAIEMYRKLSLRNPQKSTYFARKIEEVLKEKQSQL